LKQADDMTHFKRHHALPDIDPSVALAQSVRLDAEGQLLVRGRFAVEPLQTNQQEHGHLAALLPRRLTAIFKSLFRRPLSKIELSEGVRVRSDA
jgi:hypothetical protein